MCEQLVHFCSLSPINTTQRHVSKKRVCPVYYRKLIFYHLLDLASTGMCHSEVWVKIKFELDENFPT